MLESAEVIPDPPEAPAPTAAPPNAPITIYLLRGANYTVVGKNQIAAVKGFGAAMVRAPPI